MLKAFMVGAGLLVLLAAAPFSSGGPKPGTCTGAGKALTWTGSAWGCNTITSAYSVPWGAYADDVAAVNDQVSMFVVPSTYTAITGRYVVLEAGSGAGNLTFQLYNDTTFTGGGTCEIPCNTAAGANIDCAWGSGPGATAGQRLTVRYAVVCGDPPKGNITSVVSF